MRQWTFIRALPCGGHRLWRDNKTGAIAIADHSGDPYRGGFGDPDHCEVDVYWLDATRPIHLTRDGHHVMVPIICDSDGRRSHTFESFPGALVLAAEFRMQIRNDHVDPSKRRTFEVTVEPEPRAVTTPVPEEVT